MNGLRMTAMNEKSVAALAEYQAKVKSGEIVVVQKTPMQKHLENPTSLRLAINAQCYDCMGQGTPTEIRNCTATKCPLYPVRPYRD